jgi:hypothetical protein
MTILFGAGSVSAGLITNGDFENGNNGFSSGYLNTSVADGLLTGDASHPGGEGEYAVGTDPKYFHPYFVSAYDHTKQDGTGKMMIVNGSTASNVNVWTGTITSLVVGETYEFSAWVMNVYPESPAKLNFSYNGNSLGSFSATSAGVWQQFTAKFIAGASLSASAVDINMDYSGNDFALDDIDVKAVPEPSLILLLGLGIGSATFAGWRRKK